MRLEKVFQAMVKAPADPAPRLEAGRICLRNGQVSEGLRWLSGVLDLVPITSPPTKSWPTTSNPRATPPSPSTTAPAPANL